MKSALLCRNCICQQESVKRFLHEPLAFAHSIMRFLYNDLSFCYWLPVNSENSLPGTREQEIYLQKEQDRNLCYSGRSLSELRRLVAIPYRDQWKPFQDFISINKESSVGRSPFCIFNDNANIRLIRSRKEWGEYSIFSRKIMYSEIFLSILISVRNIVGNEEKRTARI